MYVFMSGFRFMRMIVFFDLPTITDEDRKNYRDFRKLLMKNGFIMMQESVYCRLLTTPTVEQSIKKILEKNKPPKGLVQSLVITEKQFSKIEFIVGEGDNEVISSDERLVIL